MQTNPVNQLEGFISTLTYTLMAQYAYALWTFENDITPTQNELLGLQMTNKDLLQTVEEMTTALEPLQVLYKLNDEWVELIARLEYILWSNYSYLEHITKDNLKVSEDEKIGLNDTVHNIIGAFETYMNRLLDVKTKEVA